MVGHCHTRHNATTQYEGLSINGGHVSFMPFRWKQFLPRIAQSKPDDLAMFTSAWLGLYGERAKDMRYDARLAKAAQTQAEWLAVNDFVEDPHIGANGSTANQRVRAAGYPLPRWYGNGNTVESVTRSWDAPDEAATDLAAHAAHHDHMLSIGWFATHTVYGIGHADTYYVVVTAPSE